MFIRLPWLVRAGFFYPQNYFKVPRRWRHQPWTRSENRTAIIRPNSNPDRRTSRILRLFTGISWKRRRAAPRKCFNFQIVSFRLLLRGLLRYLDWFAISQVPEVARVAIGIAAIFQKKHCGSVTLVPSVTCLLYFIRCSGSLIPDTCWSALIVWPCTAVNYGHQKQQTTWQQSAISRVISAAVFCC